MNFIQKRFSNANGSILLRIFLFICFPIIILVGLAIMFFAMALSLWQRLTGSKGDRQKQQELKKEQWTYFTSVNELVIEKNLANSFPGDSGECFYLDSDPEIPYLYDKYFGDWLIVDFNGVFLQKWDNILGTYCDLVFIDADTSEVIELKKDIPSRYWINEKTSLGAIKFTFKTMEPYLTYEVNLAEINRNRDISNSAEYSA